jgi:hypothetical protein
MASKNTVVDATENPAITNSAGSKLTPEQKIVEKYTKRWDGFYGKSFDAMLGGCKVLYELKGELDSLEETTDPVGVVYPTFVRKVCRMNESKASMFTKIYVMYAIDRPTWLTKYRDQLPVEYTKNYQLAKISTHELFSPEQAEQAFADTLAYMNTPKEMVVTDEDGHVFKNPTQKELNKRLVKGEVFRDYFPTVADITKFVDVLLGKIAAPSTEEKDTTPVTPEPPSIDDVPVTSKQDDVKTPVAAKVEEADNEELTEADLAALQAQEAKDKTAIAYEHICDHVNGIETYTDEHIAESEELVFAEDNNDVEIAEFNEALDKIRVRNVIRLALRSIGLHGVIVTISPKTKEASA